MAQCSTPAPAVLRRSTPATIHNGWRRQWRLGERLAGAKRALLEGSGIAEAEFAAAEQRLCAGEDAAAAMLDDRCAEAFAIAGTRPSACWRFA